MSTSGTLPFAVARAIVRELKLKSVKEWEAWSKSGQRPSNIPSHPNRTYRDDGWISMPDWLGYTGVTQHKDMLPFAAARAIVRKLKLKGAREVGVEQGREATRKHPIQPKRHVPQYRLDLDA